jgi:hypothetical protein
VYLALLLLIHLDTLEAVAVVVGLEIVLVVVAAVLVALLVAIVAPTLEVQVQLAAQVVV